MSCIKHKLVKAKKEYRCLMCCRKINVGETYRKNITTDGAVIWNNHICSNCDKMQNFLASKDCYNNCDWGDNDLFESADDYVSDKLPGNDDYTEFIQFLEDKYLEYDKNVSIYLYQESTGSGEDDVDKNDILIKYLEFIKFESEVGE